MSGLAPNSDAPIATTLQRTARQRDEHNRAPIMQPARRKTGQMANAEIAEISPTDRSRTGHRARTQRSRVTNGKTYFVGRMAAAHGPAGGLIFCSKSFPILAATRPVYPKVKGS
jgi:hypothetical protein